MKEAPNRARPRRRRLLRLLAAILLGVVIAAWTARTSILREAAALWTISDPLAPADAIAVLGGGVTSRPFVAASLYKKGLADKILVANVKPSALEKIGMAPSEAELARRILRKLGAPDQAIIGFGSDVSSTFEEARALADWAKNNRARTIIVPTELFPSRRQRWILNHELAAVGARAIVYSRSRREYSADDWWRHEDGVIDFQNEVIKYLYYRLSY